MISSLTSLINRQRIDPLSKLNQQLKTQGEGITVLNTKIQGMTSTLDPALSAAQKITQLVTTQRAIAPFAKATDGKGNLVLSKNNSVIQTNSELETLNTFILKNSKTIEAVRALRLNKPSAYADKIRQNKYSETRQIIDLLTSDEHAINTGDLNTPLGSPQLSVEQLHTPEELAKAYQTELSELDGEGQEGVLKKYALLGVKQAEKDYLEFAMSQFTADFQRIRNYSIDGKDYYSCPNPEDITPEEAKMRENLLAKFLVFIWKEQEGLSDAQIAGALLASSQAALFTITNHCSTNAYPILEMPEFPEATELQENTAKISVIPKLQGLDGRISVAVDTKKGVITTSFATHVATAIHPKTLESAFLDGDFEASHLYNYKSGDSSFEITKFNGKNGEFLIRL